MNPVNGSFTRCVRHPSQCFTGFCSSCLVERLSSIDAADFDRRTHEVKVRRTLQSLFSLDDDPGYDPEGQEAPMENDSWTEDSAAADARFRENVCDSKVMSLPNGNGHHDFPVGECFDAETLSENAVGPETSVSTSYEVLEEPNVDSYVVKELGQGGKDSKQRGITFWLGSMFSNNVLKWRSKSVHKKNLSHQKCQSVGLEEEWLESEHKFRRSCDWKISSDLSKAAWEDPRHSWDGSMMSRAFACSFSCVEETEDGNLDDLWASDIPNLSMSERKRNLPEFSEEVLSSHLKPPSRTTDTSLPNHMSSTLEKSSFSQNNVPKQPRDRFNEEHHQDYAVPGISRRKHRRWSRVWSWSITSPFREINQNQEHSLERSLSESWRENCKMKNMEKMNADNGLHLYGNGINRANQVLNRSKHAASGDLHSLRPDWQMKSREYKFGRSQSVHFYSPGNLDNGLLRFYLTPLRTSRRNTNRNRVKTSHSFRQGIFGFY